MLQNFFEKIDYIIYRNYYINDIFNKISDLITQIEPDYLNELIEDYIDQNYNKIEKITLNDSTLSPYYKFILYRSHNADIFTIKWTKNSKYKFNVDNKNNYLMYVISDGKLREHLFKKSRWFNRYIHKKGGTSYLGDYTYIEKNYCHLIKAEEYTETLHIVIYM